jgi:hypothetical protein
LLFSGVCHGTRRGSEEQLRFHDADGRHGIAGGAGERKREDVAGKHRSGHPPVFARHVLSLPPARSAVPCLTSTFYLCDLCASAVLCVNNSSSLCAPPSDSF